MRRFSEYAVAKPSRDMLFTIVDQQAKYKAKNVIETVVYRFGDLTFRLAQRRDFAVRCGRSLPFLVSRFNFLVSNRIPRSVGSNEHDRPVG